MRKAIEIEDVLGKHPAEVDGVTFDADTKVVIHRLEDGNLDLASVTIDDIAVLTNTGELIYAEGVSKDLYLKIKVIVIEQAYRMAIAADDRSWKEIRGYA